MKVNNYLIASLPDLQWEGDIKGTLQDFLDQHEALLEPYMPAVNTILLYNEIRNLELLLRKRTSDDHDYGDLFAPGILSEDEMTKFLEMPIVNQPEEYPDYMVDFLMKHHDDTDRLKSVEELYQDYFNDTKDSSSPFISFFARTVHAVRTITMAFRLQQADIPLEERLIGDEEIVETIINHRNSTDFGLKGVFPEIGELLSTFEKPVLDRERELDLFIIHLLSQYREDDLFGDHVIYLYILSLFFRDRWVLIDEEEGRRVVEEILQG
ncbi:MAG: DUF2764 family protein [Spirochaetota bacterium]